ncbi:hypothetical protein ILUMI_10673 [Ignelater luminosus]|uniref:DDE-1 domain-containing protein n=1 Tax=Ignelater luminosus TaxID=2038154 RepID=A0A8K0D1Y8_IGNLU|nr:hypothetical protein ILUMI_10673 [Ignelater luminosus]
MPRNKIRTTEHRSYSDDQLLSAVKQVSEEHKSARYVAKVTGIPRATLNRYVIKVKEFGLENVNFNLGRDHLKIFTMEQEIRRLAFEFANANNVAIPDGWKSNKMAGKDWLYSFMTRHTLSLRTPEQTSLSTTTSFNKHNVNLFFNNLKEVKETFGFPPQDVYNLDETACTTVHKPPKVLAKRGQKIVGQITSAERGTLVTFVAIVRTGWMISDLLSSVLKHFVEHERPTVANPKLIIMDNHESHLSIEALDFAKENGIILLRLPPHCSHKLQPLDVAVFRSFKKFYNAACNTWMINNPGKPITIYSLAGLVGDAFPKSFTPVNISNGFKKTGIEPFNSDIFTEEDFLSAFVTDRPASPHQPIASILRNLDEELSSPGLPLVVDAVVSPEEIRPHPKAPPRKEARNIKKKRSTILTDAPTKKALEEEAAKQNETVVAKKEI